MKDNDSKMNLLEIQKKLMGLDWVESRKNAGEHIIKMSKRQKLLSINDVSKEAFDQVSRINNERNKNNE